MSPTSKTLLVLVVLVVAGLLVVVARVSRWWWKATAATLAFLLSVGTGVLLVNDYYGYYETWGAAYADLSGNADTYSVTTAAHGSVATGNGRVEIVRLAGAKSGIDRNGLVYLPPQYFQAKYRTMRFPVVEFLHGTPGDPSQIADETRLPEIMTALIGTHRTGPMIAVMPDANGGLRRTEECLDTPKFKDDTYISKDVPDDIRAQFRASTDPAQWGIAGASSGGWCAANLAMRHRTAFGAAASIDGYYAPLEENAKQVIGSDPALLKANNPVAAALSTVPGTGPLPPFWIAAGTGDNGDYTVAKQFVHAVQRLEAVPFLVMKGARHTFGTVRRAAPSALSWMWQQLSTPSQKTDFPTLPMPAGETVRTSAPTHPIELPGEPDQWPWAHSGASPSAQPTRRTDALPPARSATASSR
ncbi:alpha/beta hydrolase [Jatrophihabitans fulvus]